MSHSDYDHSSEFTPHISLCSGYEGIGLGLHRVVPGLVTIAYCERESYAAEILATKIDEGLLDAAPIWSDIENFPYAEFYPVMGATRSICSFGFPCQPHSVAGKRNGASDGRWLFDAIADGLAVMRPWRVFIENVTGLDTSRMPSGQLCIDYIFNRLAGIGYKMADDQGRPFAGIFSASEVGAPHQRKRVFILGELDTFRSGAGRCVANADKRGRDAEQVGRKDTVSTGQSGKDGMADAASDDKWRASIPGSDRQRESPGGSSGDVGPDKSESGECTNPSKLANSDGNGRGGVLREAGCGEGGAQQRENIEREDSGDGRSGPACGEELAKSKGDSGRAIEGRDGASQGRGVSSECGPILGDADYTGSQGRERTVLPERAGERVAGETGARLDGCMDWASRSIGADVKRTKDNQPSGQDQIQSPRPAQGRIQEEDRLPDNGKDRIRGMDSSGFMGWPARPGEAQHSWEPPRVTGFKRQLGGMSSGTSDRMDEDLKYENEIRTKDKISARKTLFEVWKLAGKEKDKWSIGRFLSFLQEEVLRSGVCLGQYPKRICYFIWVIQSGYPTEGFGLRGVWWGEPAWNTPQGQKPIEQFKRELGYALCQLSYEIALERGQEIPPNQSEMQGEQLRSFEQDSWILSETFPEMEATWKSTFDIEKRAIGPLAEAIATCGAGSQLASENIDRLRACGNGVLPKTAAKAWCVLSAKLEEMKQK